ncbi:MAG: sugar phosphate isomerase/epimerase [Lentisphaerae bacterium]|nr:sugar phosphate isomerase/epimerase [Lentisphaerota bacterium]
MKDLSQVTFYTDLHRLDEPMRRCYLEEISRCGIKKLVLTNSMLSVIMGDHAMLKKYAAELEDAGLSLVDSHALYGKIWDFNAPEYRDTVAMGHRFAMNIAAQLGIKSMTFHIGNDFIYPDVPPEQHIERICRMLDILLPEAEKLDMVIAIENSWSQLASPENLLKIKALYDTEHLGFCFDSGHANIIDNGRLYEQGAAQEVWQPLGIDVPAWKTMEETLKLMQEHIVSCHLHDNNGQWDAHDCPGQGNIDWNVVLKYLHKAPRLQVYQSEVSILRHNLSIRELTGSFEKLFMLEA